MITRSQRRAVLEALSTIKSDLTLLSDSLTAKDDELCELEHDYEVRRTSLTSTERRLCIESLAYDIISGNNVAFLDSILQLTGDYFDIQTPIEIQI